MQVSQEIQNRPAKPYTSKKVSDYFSDNSKSNAQKYLTQMLFINTPALQTRASFTLEKPHYKYSDKLQTTAAPIKTAQYLNIFSIAKPVKTLTLFKTLKF